MAATSDHARGADAAATARPEVVCLGETMALVSPRAGERLATADGAELSVAGAESNVAQYLTDLGHPTAWVSRVGDDPLGARIVAALSATGVDTRWVERDATARTGLYLKDAAPEGTAVYYYRAGSAAARMTPALLDGVDLGAARVVHVSGITLAISDSAAATAARLMDRAGAAGARVSFDVNHRPKLWPVEAAAPALLAAARRADLVFVGRDEAESIWGTPTADDIRELIGTDATLVVKDSDIGATHFSPASPASSSSSADGPVFVPAPVVEVVEPVGAGDAFAAGYLSGWLRGAAPEERLRLGHAVAGLALRTVGDHADARALRIGARA